MPDIQALLDSLGLTQPDYAPLIEPRADTMGSGFNQPPSPEVYAPAPQVPDQPSFLERFGMNLFDNPVEAPQGSGFLPHFLAGFSHGLGAGTARALQKRQTLNAQLQARNAAINARNIALSDQERNRVQRLKDEVTLKAAPSGSTAVPKTLPQIQAEAQARAAGTRAGAPPITRGARPAGPAKIGGRIPQLTAYETALKGQAAGLKAAGRLAQSERIYKQAADVADVHARIRQASTVPELNQVDIPDTLGADALNKFGVAVHIRKRQIEGK